MKKILYTFIVFVICLLTACEKHDDITYFKSKCVAELNGRSFIDQTPFTIAPAMVTPYLLCDNAIRFNTLLRTERNGDIAFYVEINLFADKRDIVTDKEYIIEKTDIESLGNDAPIWDYTRYCDDNAVSYARIDSEIPDRCSIRFTAFDTEKHYHGIFTLDFSEGTLKGEFDI